MSYTVLDTDEINTRIVVRITTPSGTNTVGTQWSQVLSDRWDFLPAEQRISLTPGSNTNALSNGSRYEFVFVFRRNTNRPGIIAELEAAVAAEVADEATRLQTRYQFWGKEG